MKNEYNIGNRVYIKENLKDCLYVNPDGKMNCWAGKIMTIISVDLGTQDYCYEMKEDDDGWHWYPDMIEGRAEVAYCNNCEKFVDPIYIGFDEHPINFDKDWVCPICKERRLTDAL